jgi:HK97 family phage major capsid protein
MEDEVFRMTAVANNSYKWDIPPHWNGALITGATNTSVKMSPHPGAMIALYPSPEVALRVNEFATAMTAIEPTFTPAHAADLHVTLVYLAEDASAIEREKYEALWETLSAAVFSPLVGALNGIGRFTDPDSGAIYLNVDSPALPEFRQKLIDLVKSVGITPVENHGFTPHLTIGYAPVDNTQMVLPTVEVIPVDFQRLVLVWNGERTQFEAARLDPAAAEAARAVVEAQTVEQIADEEAMVTLVDGEGKTIKALTSELLVSYGGAIKAIASTAVSPDGNPIMRVGGYVVHWGSEDDKDLDDQYFAPDTDYYLGYFSTRPALYHHGIDLKVKGMKVGTIDHIHADDVGLWAEAQIELYNDYVRAIHQMVKRGLLKWSSGALPQLVTAAKNGKILTWPIVEGSLTPTPAKPFGTLIVPVKALKALPLPDLTKELIAEESSDVEAAPQLMPERETSPQHELEPEHSIISARFPSSSSSSSTSLETAVNTSLVTDAAPSTINEGEPMTPESLLVILKAMAEKLGIQLDEQQQQAALEAALSAYGQLAETVAPVSAEEAAKMTEEEIAKQEEEAAMKAVRNPAFLQQIAQIVRQSVPVREPAFAPTLKTAVGAAVAALPPGQSQTGAFRGNGNGNGNGRQPHIEVSSKYARLSAEDMSFVARFMKAIKARDQQAWTPAPEFMRELVDKADRAIKTGATYEKETLRGVKAWKANELNYSTLAAGGDEWVPTMWLDRIWELTRIENVVAPQFMEVDMPSNPYELPIESTDPTVSRVAETKDETQMTLAASGSPIPDSKVTTGKVTLNADKLALRVMFSEEVDEDSIIPFAGQLRNQAQRAILDAIDFVDLNADDTASGNINLDGGTPAATDKYNVVFKGIIYTGLVANSGNNKVDMGGVAPTLQYIRAARWKLASRYASRPQDLVIFCDAATYAKLLNLPEFLTMDKIGAQATIVTGMVGQIDGIPVLLTNEMALAAANGKVSSTGTNNTFGRLVYAHKPSFYQGYRRRVTVDLERLSYYDSWVLTATVRPAFVARDATCASILYNIAV